VKNNPRLQSRRWAIAGAGAQIKNKEPEIGSKFKTVAGGMAF